MNRALPEMLHCLNNPGNAAASGGADISVLERQRARMKWHPQQQEQGPLSFLNGNDQLGVFSLQAPQQFQGLLSNSDQGIGELVSRVMKPDPGVEDQWNDFGRIGNGMNYSNNPCDFNNGAFFGLNYSIPRTTSCPPSVAAAIAEVAASASQRKEASLPENPSSSTGKESFRKRKADKTPNLKTIAEEGTKDKKMKGSAEEGDPKVTEQTSNSRSTTTNNNSNKETSADNSKDNSNSKVTEVQKPDYIHVRARRGQATGSHSLAERVRREKISERMKYLQDLVPGCNKVTGKAGMLDEIINYVQSLQRQVEFLSMKLAAINPRLDFDVDNLVANEMFPTCATNVSTLGISQEMVNSAQLQLSALPQGISCGLLELGVKPPDVVLRRTISAPVSLPDTLIDNCLNQIQQSTWNNAELQNHLYSMELQQGRATAFINQPFTGFIESGNMKMEM